MRNKEIHPGAAAFLVLLAMFIVMATYVKKTEPPPTQPMSPLGPAAEMLKKHPEIMQQAMQHYRENMAHGVMVTQQGVKPAPPDLMVKARKELAAEHAASQAQKEAAAAVDAPKGNTAKPD